MKNFIKKKLKSILYFVELNFRVKILNKSPADLHLEEISTESYNFFKDRMKQSSVFTKDEQIRKYSISKAIRNNSKKNQLFLEFGVYKAESINFFANFLSKYDLEIYGFDSFQGLEENWTTDEFHAVGTFALTKNPRVSKNVKIIKGKVQDTLDNFLQKNKNSKIIFTHMDMDTYTPTKYVLNKIKPLLTKGSIILFDEFYGFPNWKSNEYKAFTEVFDENEYKYFAFGNRQVAIEIL